MGIFRELRLLCNPSFAAQTRPQGWVAAKIIHGGAEFVRFSIHHPATANDHRAEARLSELFVRPRLANEGFTERIAKIERPGSASRMTIGPGDSDLVASDFEYSRREEPAWRRRSCRLVPFQSWKRLSLK